jgi:hypothetical protein
MKPLSTLKISLKNAAAPGIVTPVKYFLTSPKFAYVIPHLCLYIIFGFIQNECARRRSTQNRNWDATRGILNEQIELCGNVD